MHPTRIFKARKQRQLLSAILKTCADKHADEQPATVLRNVQDEQLVVGLTCGSHAINDVASEAERH